MRNLLLLPLCCVFLLTACQPSDVKHLPDSALKGRRNNGGPRDRSARASALILSDYASAVHVAERQTEALSVLEMSLNSKSAEKMGYEIRQGSEGPETISLMRFGYSEKNGPFTLTSQESWDFSRDRSVVAGQASRKLLEDSVVPEAGLQVNEADKTIKIKMHGASEYALEYSFSGSMKRYKGQEEDSHVVGLKGQMTVVRLGEGLYQIKNSEFILTNQRAGEPTPFRTMVVQPVEKSVEVQVLNCPTVTGPWKATYSTAKYSGEVQLEFTERAIRQIAGRGTNSDPLSACNDQAGRPVIDFSRFIRNTSADVISL